MPGIDDTQEILSAILIIIFLSVVLTLAWMSTYVRSHSFVAAAVVVFQEQTTDITENLTENSTPQSNNQSELTRPTYQAGMNVAEASNVNEESIINSDAVEPLINTSHSETNEASGTQVEELKLEKNDTELCSQQTATPTPIDKGETDYVTCDNKITSENELDTNNENILNENILENNINESHVENVADESLTIQEDETNQTEVTVGTIRIKLRFLDDSQRLVRGHLSDKVRDFKIANFELELSSNCAVRLIFNGQLLNRDASTLEQYGLFDNCVVHCHVSEPHSTSGSEGTNNSNSQESGGFDLSDLLNPLLLTIIAFLWYLRYEYSHIFNTSATIILICLTALLLISQCALTLSFNLSLGYNSSANSDASTNSRTVSNPSVISDLSQSLQQSIEGMQEDSLNRSIIENPSSEAPVVVGTQNLEDSSITRRNSHRNTLISSI